MFCQGNNVGEMWVDYDIGTWEAWGGSNIGSTFKIQGMNMAPGAPPYIFCGVKLFSTIQPV